jgi:uncharacterized protein
MSAREVDPQRLDVAAFAKDAGQLDGCWPLRGLTRLHDAAHPDADLGDADAVRWQARGEWRRASGPGGDAGQPWLHLKGSARMALVCQRCLGAVVEPLEVERSFLFVHGEDAAAQLDADSDDDVLVLTRALDLRELLEDELLLALPLVPRHAACPAPLPLADTPALADDKPSPFAVLAALKRGQPN